MVEREKLVAMVTGVQRGDESAFNELYETFYSDLYYHIMKTVNDPELAADLTQESFMEILQTIGSLQEPAAFVTWSRQIAYHRCTGYFKKRHELLADEDEDGYSVFDTVEEDRTEFIPDAALDQQELKDAVQAMIGALPEEQRSAILLRYFDELPVAQIAQIQGVSEGTVKSRLNYGRKAIGKAVEDYERKSGVKLRCAGVVPMLLWLARISKTAAKGSAAAGTAAAGTAAAGTAAAGTAAAAGAKAAGVGIGVKIAAGVAAAAVALGTAVAVLPEKEEAPEAPQVYIGYGESYYTFDDRRFELTVEQRSDRRIEGHLEGSYLYDVFHETDFTGTGVEDDGIVTYTITFDTPVTAGVVLTYEYTETTLVYDKKADTYALEDVYEAELLPQEEYERPKVLARDKDWAGTGKDSLVAVLATDVLFELHTDRLTEYTIEGALTISRGGTVCHQSRFTGRGFEKDGCICYEVRLETPRYYDDGITDIEIKALWLIYDPEEDSFEFEAVYYYDTVMTPVD